MKNSSLKIGALFSAFSFASTFTIFIPMLTVFPVEMLAQGVQALFPDLSHVYIGWGLIALLSIGLFVSFRMVFLRVRQLALADQPIRVKENIVIMIVLYFIAQSLGYYILLAIMGFPLDALNMMTSVGSFPIVSLSFVIIGYFMDRCWNKNFHR